MRKPCGLAIALLLSLPFFAAGQQYNLGFAAGYPPYQYQEGGKPAGLDIDIAQTLGKYGIGLTIVQQNWDDVVGKLRNGLGINIVGGMEVTEERKAQFDFSPSLYTRKNVIFVLPGNNDIKNLTDLQGKIVSGDRGSYIEDQLSKMGLSAKVRLVEFDTKEESMQALKDGKVVAAIMPDAVGFYLAKKIGLTVKMVEVGDPGAPVAFAVRKGDSATLAQLNAALQKAQAAKAIDPIIAKWLK